MAIGRGPFDEVALACGVSLAVMGVFGGEDAFKRGVVRGQEWVSTQGVAERDLLVPARAVGCHDVEMRGAPPVGHFNEEAPRLLPSLAPPAAVPVGDTSLGRVSTRMFRRSKPAGCGTESTKIASNHPTVSTPSAAVIATLANGRAAGPLSTAPVSALN
jgi:hypothetical protein